LSGCADAQNRRPIGPVGARHGPESGQSESFMHPHAPLGRPQQYIPPVLPMHSDETPCIMHSTQSGNPTFAAQNSGIGVPVTPMLRHWPASWSPHGSVQRGMAVLHILDPTPPSLQSAEFMQAMQAFFTQCGRLLLRGQSVDERHWTQTPASTSHIGVLVPAQAAACVQGIGPCAPTADESAMVKSS
jgi:hypothetical protein